MFVQVLHAARFKVSPLGLADFLSVSSTAITIFNSFRARMRGLPAYGAPLGQGGKKVRLASDRFNGAVDTKSKLHIQNMTRSGLPTPALYRD